MIYKNICLVVQVTRIFLILCIWSSPTGSWLPTLKILAISCNKSDEGIFCYVNENGVTFGELLGNLKKGVGCRPLQTSWEGRWAGGWINHQWPMISTYLCNKPSVRTQKDGIQRGFGSVTTWRCWESVELGESTEAPCPFPMPCPVRHFHLAVPELYPFIINQ